MSQASPDQECVAILAPTGHDGEVAERVLSEAGFRVRVCRTHEELAAAVEGGCGAALVAAEALAHPDVSRLEDALGRQPTWSDLPLLVLTAGHADEPPCADRFLSGAGNVTLVDRPMRVATLLSMLRSAQRARRRQYEVRDYLSERERMEARLREGQRLESLGVLAGGLAHDFNNLLTTILGNAEMLRATDGLAEEPLQDIIDATHQASRLTAQMLAYAGKGHVTMKAVDLSERVASVVRLLRGAIPSGVAVDLTLPPQLPRVRADPAQLEQVVMNLVINAAESMDGCAVRELAVGTETRRVSATVANRMLLAPAPGEHVVLTVRDTGRGMDEATVARIFEPFFTTKFTGRGLGLAVVYGIIRRHGGGLGIDSTPGRGTTFEVYLPVAAPPADS